MKSSFELNSDNSRWYEEWSCAIKNKLNFSKVEISIPENGDKDLFFGSMYIEELEHDVLKTIVRSSAISTSLVHKDTFSPKENKLFIISSCGGLLVRNKNNRVAICAGDALIVPSYDELTIESFSMRNTVSIIMDSALISESPLSKTSAILWRKVSDLAYGNEMNKILLNYHTNNNDLFCAKNTQALIGLLSLEIESQRHGYGGWFIQNNKLAQILNFIKKNAQNNKLRLSLVADNFGVSERMVQYVLSESGCNFGEILSNERCQILMRKIKDNPFINVNVHIYDSGFNSICTANRSFKKKYNITPRQYLEQQKRSLSKFNSE
ncbi:AraC family transcriptional regulator [Escherichia albertii]|nr:AraC family transcriptional regulator [Escherichia albertii]